MFLAQDSNSRFRIIFASLVGTTIEFFDFYIYATAAVSVFPLLFFPSADANAALLASMATFGVAFVARPVGSILFGHFGDRVGRKATLIGSLLLMGVATFCIGLLPGHHQIGLFAPILLTILRFCQGLGLGGEWSGAALLAAENAVQGQRARAAMWPQLGAPFGFILSSGSFLLLTIGFGYDSTQANLDHPFLVWGWRLPFLLSILMVALGLYVRFKLQETPVFARAMERGEKLRSPLLQVLRTNSKEVVLGMFNMLSTYGIFYLMTTWVVSYAIGKPELGFLGIGYREFLLLQLASVFFFGIFIPIAGALADRFGRRNFLRVVTLGIMVFGLSFGSFLAPETMGLGTTASKGLMLVFLSIGMTLMGLSFGPMSALLPELFPTNTRYTGSGLAYNFASILGAALAPFVATWLNKSYGVGAVGLYLSGMAVITFISLSLSQESAWRDLDTMAESTAAIGIESTSP